MEHSKGPINVKCTCFFTFKGSDIGFVNLELSPLHQLQSLANSRYSNTCWITIMLIKTVLNIPILFIFCLGAKRRMTESGLETVA